MCEKCKKNKKNIIQTTNDYNTVPCKRCKRKGIISYPRLVEIDDIFYAQCPNCRPEFAYDILGINKTKAIENWERTMTHGMSDNF